MATPKSSPTLAKDSDILLEMETRPQGQSTVNLGLQFNSGGKDIHYVFVYERCEQTENKNENTKAKADEHEVKRQEFEKEIAQEGLDLEKEVVTLPGVCIIVK